MAEAKQEGSGTTHMQPGCNPQAGAVLQTHRALGVSILAFSRPRGTAERSIPQSIIPVKQGAVERTNFKISILRRVGDPLVGCIGADAQSAIRAKAELGFDGLHIISQPLIHCSPEV